MQGVVTDEPGFVCVKAAQAFLGVGYKRVRRVLVGEADGRRRGNRLPNSHPVYAPSRMICKQFLSLIWNFLAEGLPDRFAVAADELRHGDLETQDREIAASALHIFLKEASARHTGLEGPALGRGPCRFLGVVPACELYERAK